MKPSKVTVASFLLDQWLPAKEATVKPSSHAVYVSTVNAYVVPQIGNVRLGALDGATINAMYGRLLSSGRTGASGRGREGKPLAPKTMRNVHGMLHRAFADAVRWNLLSRNPCDVADQPRNTSAEMKTWDREQLRTFLDTTRPEREHGLWMLGRR